MNAKFDTAIEARKIVDDLANQCRKLNFNPQYKMLIGNLNKMVNDLSSAEVQARQSKKTGLIEKPKKKLADSIDYFEKLLIIQTLSQ
jgi:hypothetical protein